MNKLKTTFNGGFPLALDDVRFIDEYFRNGIHQVVRSFSDFAILTGVNPINSTTLSSGWLVINGEIGYLPETTGLDFNFPYGVVADNTFDSNVVKVTLAGASVKPNEIRQFKLESYHPSMGSDVLLSNLKPLKEVLRSDLGLAGNFKRSFTSSAVVAFVWNASQTRWESSNQHNLNLPISKIRTVSILVYLSGYSKLVPLFKEFTYELDATNLIIVDNSPNPSNDDLRSLLQLSALNVVYEHN